MLELGRQFVDNVAVDGAHHRGIGVKMHGFALSALVRLGDNHRARLLISLGCSRG